MVAAPYSDNGHAIAPEDPSQNGRDANSLRSVETPDENGRSATPGPTRPDPSLTERQLWGGRSTDA